MLTEKHKPHDMIRSFLIHFLLLCLTLKNRFRDDIGSSIYDVHIDGWSEWGIGKIS